MKPLLPCAALLLAAAAAAPALSAFDVAVSAPDLAAPAATVSAAVDLGGERLVGDDGALGWAIGFGAAGAPADGTVSGTASIGLELSFPVGDWTLVGTASGSAAADGADGVGPLAAVVGASFVHDGETAGAAIEPRLAFQWLVDPHVDLSLAGRLTFLAGSAVLEPGLAAGLRRDTGLALRIEPGLAVSWYPGIPLALETGLRWTAGLDAGTPSSAWTVTLSAAGALAGVALFTSSGSLGLGSDGWSLDAVAELALVLGSIGPAEVSLPLTASMTAATAAPATFGAGGGLRISW